jgi:hypothetical protein
LRCAARAAAARGARARAWRYRVRGDIAACVAIARIFWPSCSCCAARARSVPAFCVLLTPRSTITHERYAVTAYFGRRANISAGVEVGGGVELLVLDNTNSWVPE